MADQPISVIVYRNICPGNKQAFEKYLDEII